MAIVVRTHIDDMTQEIYDGMVAQLSGPLRASPGFISHAGGPASGGWEVTEMWESREAYDTWFNGTVKPASDAAGLSMTMTFAPAHMVIVK